MTDPRMDKLAELLMTHSVALKPGEHVLIEAFDVPQEMVIAAVRAARRVGGNPHVALRANRVLAALYADAEQESFRVWAYKLCRGLFF